jgi:hypothetical protein
MAIMIPGSIENIDGVTTGEIRVFKLFRDLLPDDYYVWYDVLVQNKYPDFIVLGPDLGIVVVEVKDWEMGSIISANSDHFELRTTGRMPENPLNQAKTYMRALLDILKTYEELLEKQGKYKGNLNFNYGHGVILSKIYLREFEEKNFKNVFPPDFVMYKDTLDYLSKNSDSDDMLERLKRMIPTGSLFTKLSTEQIEIIKSVLSRETVAQIKIEEQGAETEERKEATQQKKTERISNNGAMKRPTDFYQVSPAKQEQEEKKDSGFQNFIVVAIIMVVAGIVWNFYSGETGRVSNSPDISTAAVQKDELKDVHVGVPPQVKLNSDQVRNEKKPTLLMDESKKIKTVKPSDNEDSVQAPLQKTTLPKKENNSVKYEGVWIKGNINPEGEKIYHLPQGKYYSKVKPESWFKTEQDAINAGYRKANDYGIKGNISRSGEKIYHMKGQRYYDQTTAEEWFKSEEEAVSAGYRKSMI